MVKKNKIDEIFEKLEELYPMAFCELDYNNTFELLLATILSAQCTDIKVNKVTPIIFEKCKTPSDILELGQKDLMKIIRPCGLSKSKSNYIVDSCQIMVDKFNSEVPSDEVELQKLPGVGRKTSNVVLSVGFGIPKIAVDTHVFRVSNRIGLVDASTVLKTEKDLMDRFPEDKWIRLHHLLIFHGRYSCKARKPACEECALNYICEYYNKGDKNERK